MEIVTKQYYDVRIEQARNGGYIVRVGCENFIYPGDSISITQLCKDLHSYLVKPSETIDNFHAYRNKMESGRDCCGTEPCDIEPPRPHNQAATGDGFSALDAAMEAQEAAIRAGLANAAARSAAPEPLETVGDEDTRPMGDAQQIR